MHLLFNLLILCGGLVAVVVQTDNVNELLGQALLDALDKHRVAVKVAAPIMGLDESNLRKQIRGEEGHELRIARVMRLGFPIFADFWSAAIYIRGQQALGEAAADATLRRSA